MSEINLEDKEKEETERMLGFESHLTLRVLAWSLEEEDPVSPLWGLVWIDLPFVLALFIFSNLLKTLCEMSSPPRSATTGVDGGVASFEGPSGLPLLLSLLEPRGDHSVEIGEPDKPHDYIPETEHTHKIKKTGEQRISQTP